METFSKEFLSLYKNEMKDYARKFYIEHKKPKNISDKLIMECYNQFSDELMSITDFDNILTEFADEFHFETTSSDEEKLKTIKQITVSYKFSGKYSLDYIYERRYELLDVSVKKDVLNLVKFIIDDCRLTYDSIVDYGFFDGKPKHGYMRIYVNDVKNNMISIKFEQRENDSSIWNAIIKLKRL